MLEHSALRLQIWCVKDYDFLLSSSFPLRLRTNYVLHYHRSLNVQLSLSIGRNRNWIGMSKEYWNGRVRFLRLRNAIWNTTVQIAVSRFCDTCIAAQHLCPKNLQQYAMTSSPRCHRTIVVRYLQQPDFLTRVNGPFADGDGKRS
jgi:hypothetical protein